MHRLYGITGLKQYFNRKIHQLFFLALLFALIFCSHRSDSFNVTDDPDALSPTTGNVILSRK